METQRDRLCRLQLLLLLLLIMMMMTRRGYRNMDKGMEGAGVDSGEGP